jgi:chromosome segregation ATPase
VENSLRQEYGDQIDALEQQKKSLQQSVVHTKSEMEILQGQHSELKAQQETLTTENKDLQRRWGTHFFKTKLQGGTHISSKRS